MIRQEIFLNLRMFLSYLLTFNSLIFPKISIVNWLVFFERNDFLYVLVNDYLAVQRKFNEYLSSNK